MAKASRTLNPLHFEDLEPHRFEDLVRQLVYDFRDWASLEAIGRTGADEGIDIRAIELALGTDIQPEDEFALDGEDADLLRSDAIQRGWLIQCKRERALGPKRVRSIVSDNLSAQAVNPYGYILAAACDFSMAARNAFRDEARAQGIQEFYIWGKAEIEDQLILPKNDYLLFAYFGISLQIQRRTIRSLVRSRLALKRKLIKTLGEPNHPSFLAVLVRDPDDQQYPFIRDKASFLQRPHWRYWWFHSHQPPDHLAFISRRYHAYVNWDTQEWDAMQQYDTAVPAGPGIHGLDMRWWDTEGRGKILDAYWNHSVTEEHRAWALELRTIHYDRIIAIDELGDTYHDGPHLLVHFIGQYDPFEPGTWPILESSRPYFNTTVHPDKEKRVRIFPDPVPDQREEYLRDLDARVKRAAS